MGEHCYHSSSFLKCTVPRNLGSCSKDSFAFPCISDCNPVMASGRGWGFPRLTFPSRLKHPSAGVGSRRRGATGVSTPSVATTTGSDGIPTGSPQSLCPSYVLKEKGVAKLVPCCVHPTNQEGWTSFCKDSYFGISHLPEVYA